MKYVVCFSGGVSSALCAFETVKKYGKKNVILLNHDISSQVEHKDVKRFKQEVANYLGLKITYANMENFEEKPPLKLCIDLGGWKFNNSPILCTYKLKTEPFYKWLKENYPNGDDVRLVYGFDANEGHRIERRIFELNRLNYKAIFPLTEGDYSQVLINANIKIPEQYAMFKHANCIGCLKAGRQHWYIVYTFYNEIFEEAKKSESIIGYSILKNIYMEELEPLFKKMKDANINPTELIESNSYWASVKNELNNFELGQLKLFNEEISMPCDCHF